MRLGDSIIQVIRTVPIGTGMRSVWYLPRGDSVHAIEDKPIPLGTYFLRPDDTGRFRNWVIECKLGTRAATYFTSGAPFREHVEIHAGNTLSDTKGCVIPGTVIMESGVVSSRVAVKVMRDALQRDEDDPPVWIIEIKGAAS